MSQSFAVEEDYSFFEKSDIFYNKEKPNLQKLWAVVHGKNRVFVYTSNNAGDPGNHSIAPAKLAFWIDSKEKSFELRDEQIEQHGGTYVQLCRCQDRGVKRISEGVIKGSRIDDTTWHVEIDVHFLGRTTQADYYIKTEGDFKLDTRD